MSQDLKKEEVDPCQTTCGDCMFYKDMECFANPPVVTAYREYDRPVVHHSDIACRFFKAHGRESLP